MKFRAEAGTIRDQVVSRMHAVEDEHYKANYREPKPLITVNPRGRRELAHSAQMYYGNMPYEYRIGRHKIVEVPDQTDDTMIWKCVDE